ncbi:MAG: copper amine oxidase N-terminal domain-containing protein [Oscillospiraceae bacterium]|nr:copper amine oxidase N-terminal domain-containing protein [Oscillospiraceae bacterium]
MKKMIKKIISSLCAVSILLSVAAMPSYADDNIKVFLDGSEIQFDVPPQIIDDYTMVPMRAIFEALGYYVEWDQESQIVMAVNFQNDTAIILDCENSAICVCPASEAMEAMLSEETVEEFVDKYVEILEQKIPIIDGRTLVPVRVISESSGCDVQWNGNTRSVYITSAPEQQDETLFFDEFTGIPAPNANPIKKEYMQPEIQGYYTYIYDYNNSELTNEKIVDYMKTLEEYEFYLDQDCAKETGAILYSYNNYEGIITFSSDDTITRIIVSIRTKAPTVSYYAEYKDVPDLSSVVSEYKFINKKIDRSQVTYQYSYLNQSLDPMQNYIDLLKNSGFIDITNNNYNGMTFTNKNVSVNLFADDTTKIIHVTIDQLVEIPTNNSSQYTPPSDTQQNYPSGGQTESEYNKGTNHFQNYYTDEDIEGQRRAAYESELAAINAKYDAMIKGTQEAFQKIPGYKSSQAISIFARQEIEYKRQRDEEIAILKAKYGYDE